MKIIKPALIGALGVLLTYGAIHLYQDHQILHSAAGYLQWGIQSRSLPAPPTAVAPAPIPTPIPKEAK